jgi:hypothetical protein
MSPHEERYDIEYLKKLIQEHPNFMSLQKINAHEVIEKLFQFNIRTNGIQLQKNIAEETFTMFLTLILSDVTYGDEGWSIEEDGDGYGASSGTPDIIHGEIYVAFRIENVIISNPDSYLNFQKIFNDEKLRFKRFVEEAVKGRNLSGDPHIIFPFRGSIRIESIYPDSGLEYLQISYLHPKEPSFGFTFRGACIASIDDTGNGNNQLISRAPQFS